MKISKVKKIKKALLSAQRVHKHVVAIPVAFVVLCVVAIVGLSFSTSEAGSVQVKSSGVYIADTSSVTTPLVFTVLLDASNIVPKESIKKIEFMNKGAVMGCGQVEYFRDEEGDGVRCLMGNGTKISRGVGYRLLDENGESVFEGVVKTTDPRKVTLVFMKTTVGDDSQEVLSARSAFIFDKCTLHGARTMKEYVDFDGDHVSNPWLQSSKLPRGIKEDVFVRCHTGDVFIDSEAVSIEAM
jgi:hypothetical protein